MKKLGILQVGVEVGGKSCKEEEEERKKQK